MPFHPCFTPVLPSVSPPVSPLSCSLTSCPSWWWGPDIVAFWWGHYNLDRGQDRGKHRETRQGARQGGETRGETGGETGSKTGAKQGVRQGVGQGARQVHSLLLPLTHMVEVTLNSSMVVGTLKSSIKCYINIYNVDFHDFSHHRTYSMVWKRGGSAPFEPPMYILLQNARVLESIF